jgi:bacterioferritin-associated ferredoxin
MEKHYNWHETGRERLGLTLQIKDGVITHASMRAKGCLSFLTLSQKMKAKLLGPVGDLLPPSGKDHASMIWREMIAMIRGEWKLPVQQEELCHCRKISTQKVDRSIVFGAHTVEEVRKRTSANTGCGTCKSDVEALIENRLKVK